MRVVAMTTWLFAAAVVMPARMVSASDQTTPSQTPCGEALANVSLPGTHGLTLADGGALVYDSNVGVCWLSNANLAGNPLVRALVGLSPMNPDGSTPVINPDGTMDYETALNWVDSLNRFNHGKGWLNHNNWQLPATPLTDHACSSSKDGDFGVRCEADGLANLYKIGLARAYPDSVVPWFIDFIWPFFNLQPSLYWTSDPDQTLPEGGGEVTFSFNTGLPGSNTIAFNYFHVLPMTATVLGPTPSGPGVVPYTSGPAAGRAVYDTATGMSWPLNANLAAFENFGVTGSITLTDVEGRMLTVPLIDRDGAVHFSAINPANTTSGWIVSMNANNFAGTNTWTLPSLHDLKLLHADLGLRPGDTRLEWPFFVGAFWGLQPGFYWSCERDEGPNLNAPCDPTIHPGDTPMEYSFNFDDGFLGTDHPDKQFYVMVYFPAP
jgi:hypothetical protein